MVALSSWEWQPVVSAAKVNEAMAKAPLKRRRREMEIKFMGEIYDGLSTLGGTGSWPCVPQGWQREMRRSVRPKPFHAPHVSNASMA